MYCEHCQKIFAGDMCPDCHGKGREAQETDVCFLTERSHPWSDMLVDVLKQADIPCLRQGSLGAGMMMAAGQYLDMESLFVLHKHLEQAKEIMVGLFGPVSETIEAEDEKKEAESVEERYQVTGNEYVSLPTIREADGAVEGISCLYMQVKGMLELKGQERFMQPFFMVDGERMPLRPTWQRRHFWVPSFEMEEKGVFFRCTYLAPVGERGFGIRLEAENRQASPCLVNTGLEGEWTQTLHTVNESLPLEEGLSVRQSGWNHMFIYQQTPGLPLVAFAPIVSDDQPFSEMDQGATWQLEGMQYIIQKEMQLQPGENMTLDVFFGLGYEGVAAATSAKEMLRQGFDTLLERTESWLAAREKKAENAAIETLLNTNLFYAFFFASGRTIDSEELCMMTSRSPRYYVSAAYWDRDSLLWAFPAIVEADGKYARELLLSIFQRQGRNFGIHSRYIDGTVLEAGFELDELCAPVIALERYIAVTGDKGILQKEIIRQGLEGIVEKLMGRKHPDKALFSTFLQPTDDMHNYPYLTYDNVLVWKALSCLGEWLRQRKLSSLSDQVKKAILENCVFEHGGKKIFAWSVDGNGKWDIYDEPPGSLQLLPFYGFCSLQDAVWQNTMALIRNAEYPLSFHGHAIAEIGCKHAPHPWVLSMCNSLLSGQREEALLHLQRTRMDNGIACESVHEDTGECTTGAAFATCAGFLAYALTRALAEERKFEEKR